MDTIRTGAAYIRVSTDDQLEHSPESQLIEIENYARSNNIIILKDYIFIEKEGISGKKADKREEFQRMISISKDKPKPFDVILVWKFSRFARNQDESTFYKGMLRKKLGIDIISISEPIMEGMYGRLIEMIIEWQDEFYSYNLSGEVKRSMRMKAEKGEYNAGVPLGYKKIKGEIPTIVPSDAEIVKMIFNLYANGKDKNYIVRRLNSEGILTQRKNQFTSETISYVLENPFYIGKIRWNRRNSSGTSKLKDPSEWIIADSYHEPIIDYDTWDTVQQRLSIVAKTREKYSHPISHTKHWLSGLVKCSICGKSLSPKFQKKTNTYGFQCLGYRNGIHNDSQYVSEKKLIKYVLNSLEQVASSKIFDFEITTISKNVEELEMLDRKIQRLKKQEARCKEAYLNEIDTLIEYKANRKAIKCSIEQLTAQKDSYNKSIKDTDADQLFLRNINNVIEILKSSVPYQEKAEALRSITQKIEFDKEHQEIICYYYLSI